MIEFIKNTARQAVHFRLSYIASTFLVFALINAVWIIASHWVFVFRPLFNYDYLLAIMLIPFSAIAALAMFLFVYVQELFISNAMVFHFTNLSDFFRAGKFIDALNIREFLKLQDVLLFVSFAAAAFFGVRFLKGKTNFVAAVIVLLCAFGADQLNGSSYLLKSDRQIVEGNVGGSSALKIYTSFKENNMPRTMPARIDPAVLPLAKSEALSWLENRPLKSILYVVVESYGLNESREAADWLYRQLAVPEISKNFDVEYGAAAFSGATTASELRHLCALKGSYNSWLPYEVLDGCIPKALADRGYRVVGAHGFTGNMFRRSEWWPMIGLAERLFVDDFAKLGAPFCGSGMYGICDDFVIRYLGEQMTEQPGFYYHLTLNTHLPVVETVIPPDLSRICGDAGMGAEACLLNAKVAEYFSSLRDVLAGLPEKPLVFVVGDHAPPFTSKASRKFSRKETPYFILRPKE